MSSLILPALSTPRTPTAENLKPGAIVAITLTDVDGVQVTDYAEIVEHHYLIRWAKGGDSYWAVGQEEIYPLSYLASKGKLLPDGTANLQQPLDSK